MHGEVVLVLSLVEGQQVLDENCTLFDVSYLKAERLGTFNSCCRV